MDSGMATRPATVRARILDAALALAADHGWRDLTLGQIAAAAKVSLAQLHGAFPGKADILMGVMPCRNPFLSAGTGSQFTSWNSQNQPCPAAQPGALSACVESRLSALRCAKALNRYRDCAILNQFHRAAGP